MAQQGMVDDKNRIATIMDFASRYKLDAHYTVREESFDSYFLGMEKMQHVVILNRCSPELTEEAISPGSRFPVRFDYVDQGQKYTFAFPFKVQKVDSFKLFSAIYGEFPTGLTIVAEPEPYQLVLTEDEPVFLEFSLKDQHFREEVVMLSSEGLQFYPKSKGLVSGKTMWAGRKLEESRIVFPFGTVPVDMQLSKREGSGWSTRFVAADPDEMDKISQFLTRKFFDLNYKFRFVKDDTLVEDARSVKSWESRKILIFDRDEDTNLALREHLIGMGYEVSGVFDSESALRLIRAQKPVLAIVDVPSPKSEGMKFAREVKDNFYTKNIPVLFLSSHFKQKDLPVISHYGAKDLLEKPFDIASFEYKVNLILNPSQAGKAPEASGKKAASAAEKGGAAASPTLGTVVLANKNDEETACRVFDWARQRQLEVIMVEELSDFRRETIYKKPLVAIVNLQDVRQNVIIEKCQEFKTMGLKRPLPVFIADKSLKPDTLQRAEQNMFRIHSVSDTFLGKLDSLIRKLSGR